MYSNDSVFERYDQRPRQGGFGQTLGCLADTLTRVALEFLEL
jgi:hypothetical protein